MDTTSAPEATVADKEFARRREFGERVLALIEKGDVARWPEQGTTIAHLIRFADAISPRMDDQPEDGWKLGPKGSEKRLFSYGVLLLNGLERLSEDGAHEYWVFNNFQRQVMALWGHQSDHLGFILSGEQFSDLFLAFGAVERMVWEALGLTEVWDTLPTTWLDEYYFKFDWIEQLNLYDDFCARSPNLLLGSLV